jgi:L-threonylcarbamoyladenylate synthase
MPSPARILQPHQLDEAVDMLRDGALVAFPTDTVYGVAARADDNYDNAKLREFKQGRTDQFSLHTGSVETAIRYAGGLKPAEAYALLALTPHGVTVVIARGEGSLGVRVVSHEIGSPLLDRVGAAVVATSANAPGQPPLREPAQIAQMNVDAVIDGGVLPKRPASTVVRLLPCGLEVLRVGPVEKAELGRIYTRPVHFVCLGNLNRSAFAAALVDSMQTWVAEITHPFVPAYLPSSSGLIAHPDTAPPLEMLRVAADCGVNLSMHEPRRFSPVGLPPTVVSMGDDVVGEIEKASPRNLLRWSVQDPMGGPEPGYRRAAAQIAAYVRDELLCRWAEGGALEGEFEKVFYGQGDAT